jgi:hypothetical protein
MRKDYEGGERVVCGEKNTKKQKMNLHSSINAREG